jgi:dTDP-4-dehydrorhamnose 3,5-epimerase
MHSFYCPVGFAHGFFLLSDVADVLCKQSNYHADETERGIAYDTPMSRSSGGCPPSN